MHDVPYEVLETPDREAATSRFTIRPGRMLYEMIALFGVWWYYILGGVVLLGIVASFFDLRLLIMALMVVFIIIPMLMAMFYLNYGLREECFLNTVPHTLRHTDDGLEVTLIFSHPSEEEEGESIEKIRRMSFSYNEIASLSVVGSYTVAIMRKPLRGFVMIPRSAFAVDDEYYTFTRKLREKVVVGADSEK